MKTAKYERNHHTIKNLATGKRDPFRSCNQAKRKSRELQMAADNALGMGTVRLVS